MSLDMDKKLLQPGKNPLDRLPADDRMDRGVDSNAGFAELGKVISTVNEGIDIAAEGAEDVGVFSEKNSSKAGENKGGASGQARKTLKRAVVKDLPTIEIMMGQTVTAIKVELNSVEKEIKVMMKSKNKPHLLNDKVKRARVLAGLLQQLQRAAKVAEDFVIGLWKQFCQKSS